MVKLKSSGQSLLEVIVVIATGVIVIGALTFVSIASLRNAQAAKNQAQATKLTQEGIERVRIGRDRNRAISALPNTTTVNSWGGDGTINSDVWSYQVSSSCAVSPDNCYLKVNSDGSLIHLPPPSPSFPTSSAETVGNFKRAVILSDQPLTFTSEKTVTVIVTWTDFAGTHESRQTTYLRSI